MKMYRIHFLRRAGIPLLKFFAFDIKIKHHHIKNNTISLNTFQHKGYWFHGKQRESMTMLLFKKLINTGDTIVEVGGHIGYVSLYFSRLAGPKGKVIVFEPGSNNLPYIKQNIRQNGDSTRNIQLIEAAVGKNKGEAIFYEDLLTGQNNSLVKDFDGLKVNQKNSFVRTAVRQRQVEVIAIDDLFLEHRIHFIKIDIEGGEWPAIQGAANTIRNCYPVLMTEIQANRDDIMGFFQALNYIGLNEKRQLVTTSKNLNGNIFWLHQDQHKHLITSILIP